MSARRRTKKQPFGWMSALLFNALLIGFAYITSLLIVENKKALGEEFVTSSEAVSATQAKMSEMFSAMVPEGREPREFWASEINKQLAENDLDAARGLLLAAPSMLNKKDAGAVLVAAETETEGRLDERLLSASTLFLPDDVRAKYARATSPVEFNSVDIDPSVDGDASDEPDTKTPDQSTSSAFFVLGNERDLAYQAAGWLRDDRVDTFSLSISGLGLAAQQGKFKKTKFTDTMLRGASLIKSARRAGRLRPEFEEFLEKRLENALPAERLRKELMTRFNEGGSIFIQSDAILAAFVAATNEANLEPFLEDLERLAHLSDDRTNASAMTIIETISSLRDLKRAELIAFSGGDRAVVLAKYYGPKSLNAAQTVLDWTMKLIGLIMSAVFVFAILLWLALSTLGRSSRRTDSFGHHYGYS